MLPPTPTDPLVTSAQFTAIFGVAPTDQQRARMDAADAAIRRWCGWHIAPVLTQTFTVDGPGTNVLMLPTGRLVDLTALSEIHRTDTVTLSVTPVTGDVDWSHNGYVYRSGGHRFTNRLRGVQVTISHGYDDVTDLALIVSELAARAQPAGVKSKARGDRSVTFFEPGLMQYEKDQLRLFRLESVR